LNSCATSNTTTKPNVSKQDKLDVIQSLNETISVVPSATVTTSDDIDWHVGVLPWDRFTLPSISPNGLHAAVQLGTHPSIDFLCGHSNTSVDSTTIELHQLDPMRGKTTTPIVLEHSDLILCGSASNHSFLVEAPMGKNSRWIGTVDWSTGIISWIVSDNNLNAFPAMNIYGDIAWSQQPPKSKRFYLILMKNGKKQIIDDGISDWIAPTYVDSDRIRVYRLNKGKLDLVEIDLNAREPLLTTISLTIMESGASRATAWQIASTNPTMIGTNGHAFYHPLEERMVIWQPESFTETTSLTPYSIAAVPVSDESWLVATDNRTLRQKVGDKDGIQLRNKLCIPIETTSKQWTHLMLIPDRNRLQVRAINLSN
jgi:hypothetical protein